MSEDEQERRWEKVREERWVGVGEKAAFNRKRPEDTKGRRMTGARVKPAQ